VHTISEALPAMQEMASRCWIPDGFPGPRTVRVTLATVG